ncbi:SIS domain-containing protein [candidate division WOR-3 bacterium]|nr:SIS domain-containing protein [candidate division WOR-3 bacterium]
MNSLEIINESINESIKVKELLKKESSKIEEATNVVSNVLNNGGEILLCGNGGSAADSQHIACEFVCKLQKERKSLPAIAFTTNTSLLTAISNDTLFDLIFARQIEGIGTSKDLLIAISISGNSLNILKAVETSKSIGIYTIGLTGKHGGELASSVDLSIKVPSSNTQRIQEAHILIGHIICELVEKKLGI